MFDFLKGGKRRSNKSSKRTGRKLRKSAKRRSRRSSKRVRGGALTGSEYTSGAGPAEPVDAFGGMMLPEGFKAMEGGEEAMMAMAGAAPEDATALGGNTVEDADPMAGGARRRRRKGRKSMDPGMGAAAALLAANIAYGRGRKSRKQRKSRRNRTNRRR